jgi:peptide/nickel transport system substrate-binding protein
MVGAIGRLSFALRSGARVAGAVALAAVVVLLVLTGTAFGRGSGAVTIVLPFNPGVTAQADFTTFDLQAEDLVGANFATGFYDRLMALGPNGLPTPWLGTPTSSTARAVTFKIRSGATCPDGSAVDAGVVRESFERLLTVPKRSNHLSFYFGPGPFAVSADVGKGTFTFRTGTPNRNLLYGFTAPGTIVICPAGFRALAANPQALETGAYGSGPYTLVSATHAIQVVMQKRAAWKWGPRGETAQDLADTIVLKPVPNIDTGVNQALTGDLDLISVATAGPNLDRMKASSDFASTVVRDWAPTHTLVFSQRPGTPTTNKALREALSMTIDRRNFMTAASSGLGTLLDSLLQPGMECYNKSVGSLIKDGSIDQAKQVLTSAGYTYRGSDLYDPAGERVKIRILVNISLIGSAGEYMQAQWSALGVDVDLAQLPVTAYAGQFVSLNFDAAPSALSQTFKAPGARLGLFWGLPFTNGGSGAVIAHDAALDREFRLALATTGQESCRHFTNAIKRGFQNYWWKPLYADLTYYFTRKAKIRSMWPGSYRGWEPITVLVPKS